MMKLVIGNILLLLVYSLLLGNQAQAQTGYFRVANGLPCMPVLANSSAISAPATGSLFYSTDDSQPHIYTGSSWISLCSATAPVSNNGEAWFRVVEGIPVLPLQDTAAITGTAGAGTVFYSASGGITVSDGSNWKSMYNYANTDDVTVTGGVQMGAVSGINGLFTIPVLDAEPASPEAGAFYFDSATSVLRVYNGSAWGDIDCGQCPPQATAVIIRDSASIYSFGGYAYYDHESRSEDTGSGYPAYRWFISSAAGGTATETLSTDENYVYDFQDANQDKYLNLGITVSATGGSLTESDETVASVLLDNCPPNAAALMIVGLGDTIRGGEESLTAAYAYYDKENDEEGASVINWYVADDAEGTNKTLRGTGSSYPYPFSYIGKYLCMGVTPKAATGYSTGEEVFTDYYPIITPSAITVYHVADDGVSAETVTITYPVVAIPSGTTGSNTVYWFAQNLGATTQPASATDATDAAAGWYWQFNTTDGHAYNSDSETIEPSTGWDSTLGGLPINYTYWGVYGDNDPCKLLLGNGWHLPTETDWENALGSSYSYCWTDTESAFNSALRLHCNGYIHNDLTLRNRGTQGYYWTSKNSGRYSGVALYVKDSAPTSNILLLYYGANIRCLWGN